MIRINQDRIKEFLEFRRWNRSDLAKAMGYSDANITLVLNENRLPSSKFMTRLVEVTGLSLGELFFCSKTDQMVGHDDK